MAAEGAGNALLFSGVRCKPQRVWGHTPHWEEFIHNADGTRVNHSVKQELG